MNRSKLVFTAIFIAFFLAFWTKASITLDPDFGYRVTTGMRVLSDSIPATDPYSYTMPSIAFVEHSFLIAVIWGLLYPYVGYVGTALFQVIVAGITILTLYHHGRTYLKRKRVATPAFMSVCVYILAIGSLITFFGVRAQVISWLFFSLLFYLLFPKKHYHRFRFVIPFLFFVWANTHGSFIAGLAILTASSIVRFIIDRSINLHDSIAVVASYVLTLANPYGLGIWHESLRSITDVNMRTYIYEWMPPFLSLTPAIGVYTTFVLFFLLKYRREYSLTTQVVLLLTLAGALSSTRNIPIFIIFSAPLGAVSVSIFEKEIQTIQNASARFALLSKLLFCAIVVVVSIQVYFDIHTSRELSENAAFPRYAVKYLKSHTPRGEIFSQFYWGGYLSWKLPEKRVFIDGRMTSWKNPDAPKGETSDAFSDYIGILEGTIDYHSQFEKYGVDTVLWSSPAEQEVQTESFVTTIVSTFVKKSDSMDLISAIKTDGWTIVYQDDVATIYKKPNTVGIE